MSLEWRVEPIERWPGPLTVHRQRSRFRAGWTDTVTLLEREVGLLGADTVIFQMAVTPSDIRLDGKIRANARPAAHPGIIVLFDSRHGPLTYPCDTYDDWQDNVRAVALSLNRLRDVDRYGVSQHGEQYRGWAKLPPAGGSSVTLNAREAAEFIAEAIRMEVGVPPEELLTDAGTFRQAYRDAARALHPDVQGGSVRAFQTLQHARNVLQAYHERGGTG